MSAHSPLPWRVFMPQGAPVGVKDADGFWVSSLHDHIPNSTPAERAALICRAVNAHAELVAALRRLIDAADSMADAANCGQADDAVEQARATLAKLEQPS